MELSKRPAAQQIRRSHAEQRSGHSPRAVTLCAPTVSVPPWRGFAGIVSHRLHQVRWRDRYANRSHSKGEGSAGLLACVLGRVWQGNGCSLSTFVISLLVSRYSRYVPVDLEGVVTGQGIFAVLSAILGYGAGTNAVREWRETPPSEQPIYYVIEQPIRHIHDSGHGSYQIATNRVLIDGDEY